MCDITASHPAHVIPLLVALFASPVRSITPPWSPSLHQGTTDDLITYYFNAGHQYIKIVYFLCIVHGLVISMRQLKRKLKRLGLRRRAPKTAANFRHVCRLIWREVKGSGIQLGYRALWRRLIMTYKIPVARTTVMKVLKHNITTIDSVLRRRHRPQRRVYHNKGPNYVWHIDGYDISSSRTAFQFMAA
jgi:hypothetical protein